MIYRTTKEFQNAVLKEMNFSPFEFDNYTIFKNESKPELGYFIKYSREGYYDFGIGDYTIAKNFSLDFDHHESLMRFGTVYIGETKFEIEGSTVSSFTPSSFFVCEKNIKGRQTWIKNQHFHGAEFTIYKKYFDEVIKPNFPNSIDYNHFITNYTYRYLPIEISSIIQNLRTKAELNTLTPLYLESKVLECIALLYSEVTSSPENVFTNQLNYGEIKIGKDRSIKLTASDINALHKAHDILTKELLNPPTIKSLSKRVFLNEQKLKAGFSLKYHMSIKEYTNSLRMTMAENLLCTTEMSVDEIAKTLGYSHSGNFIKSFKNTHGKTPASFRNVN